MSAEPDRRQRLLQMAAGAAFLVLAVVLVLIVVNSSGGSGGDAANIEGAAEVDSLLAGIPQEGMVLGDPKAPVELIEFGDLQCPVCAGYAEEFLPPIIENQVKKGEVKIDFRNLTIIGEESVPAGAATLAAGEQGRGWNYLDLFYKNQGEERSGYVTDEFMEAVAKAAGVKDVAKWNEDRKQLNGEVEKTTAEAQDLGYNATPSFAIEGPGTKGLELLGTPESTGALEDAIEAAK
ncbi:MAG TPA: thioredoxin domain-containing protein [Solirubrobacterales bacterium]|nr:thioredoxin domain-containing protein [Solirubrobacterales bacterium]